MAYLSSTKDEVYLNGLGYGPGCSCGPCKSFNLSEWYEKEEEEPPEEPQSRAAPVKASTPPPQRLSGWHRLSEWYEKEEEEEEDEPRPRTAGKASAPQPQRLSGWNRFGFGNVPYAYRGFLSEAPATASGVLADPRVNSQLPAVGPGFYPYYATDARGRLDNPPGYHRYGLPEVIRAIQSIAAEWLRLNPRGPRLGIGDLSLIGGGPTPRHGAHQRGLEVDIRPPRSDGRELPATFRDPNYSRVLTQQLVELINRNPILRVRVILFNDPGIRGVTPYAGHNDHLHVGFLPPGTPSQPSQPGRSNARARGGSPGGAVTGSQSVSPEVVRKSNQIFNARHPELRGRPIQAGESQLAAEWRSIRDGLLRGNVVPASNGTTPRPTPVPPSTPQPISSPRLDPLNKLAGVHPELARRIVQIAGELSTGGVKLTITRSGGRRTFQEQDELYAQGRTRPGNIVTNSRGGQSNHNYGLAVDVVPLVNGQPNWNVPASVWQTIGEAGKRAGLNWGGDWRTFKDPPHFELPVGMSIQECLRIHQQGGLSAVWAEATRRLQRS
jgi:hypothetical protein